MAQIQISIPTSYARLYPAWTAEDHKIFRDAYAIHKDQLEAFKVLLAKREVPFAHLEENA